MHWLLIGYMFLFIDRPFEVWPALGDLHVERAYMAFTLVVWAVWPGKRFLANPQHAAYAAHDLEGFLAMYSPTARIQLADGTELKGRRFLREYYRPQFDAGRCKTEVVQKLMIGEWVVEHQVAHASDAPAPLLALYRVADGLITDVEFRV